MEVWCEIRKDVDRGARRLVAEYGNRLLAAASCLCPNDQDAEELVFRTFDQAVKKIRQYRPNGDFFCWLYTIMLNYRRMDLRRRSPSVVPVGSSLDLPEVPTAVLPSLDGEIGSERILAALRALPEAIRAVVVLKYFDDCSVETIARQLAVPVGAACRAAGALRLFAETAGRLCRPPDRRGAAPTSAGAHPAMRLPAGPDSGVGPRDRLSGGGRTTDRPVGGGAAGRDGAGRAFGEGLGFSPVGIHPRVFPP